MKFFEKNLKDRFQNTTSLEGVDVDELWNDIAPVIAEKDQTKPLPFWPLLLMICLPLFIGLMAWQQIRTEAPFTSVAASKNINSEAPFQSLENTNSGSEEINSKAQNSSVKPNENVTLNERESSEHTTPPQSKNTDNQNFTSKNKATSLIPADLENDLIATQQTAKAEVNEEDITRQKEDLDGTPLIDQEEVLINNISRATPLGIVSKIASLPISLLEKEHDFNLNKLITPLDLSRSKSRLALGVFASTHTVKNRFSSALSADQERSDLLNKNYHYELGYSFAVEGAYYFRENLFISSGLEYLKSRSEFNLNLSWDTIIVNPNSPVGSLTDAKATRTIKHHNTLSYASIPILFGIQKSAGNITFGTSLGIGLNFTKSHSGKSLNYNNEVASFPNTENSLLTVPAFFLSYHFRPYLNIQLNKTMNIQLRLDTRYQHFQKPSFYELSQATVFVGFGAGLQYKF